MHYFSYWWVVFYIRAISLRTCKFQQILYKLNWLTWKDRRCTCATFCELMTTSNIYIVHKIYPSIWRRQVIRYRGRWFNKKKFPPFSIRVVHGETHSSCRRGQRLPTNTIQSRSLHFDLTSGGAESCVKTKRKVEKRFGRSSTRLLQSIADICRSGLPACKPYRVISVVESSVLNNMSSI